MAFKIKASGINWGNYKDDLVANTDLRKFDGTLRQVISGTTPQRLQLESYLFNLYGRGKCAFGIQDSNAALITCMIDNREGEHYHFVDSAGGGYTAAAKAVKKQMDQAFHTHSNLTPSEITSK